MQWLLWVCWKMGGWIGLVLPAAAVVVVVEHWSMIQGARGGASSDLDVGSDAWSWRSPAMGFSQVFGWERVQGPVCNFCFS